MASRRAWKVSRTLSSSLYSVLEMEEEGLAEGGADLKDWRSHQRPDSQRFSLVVGLVEKSWSVTMERLL